MTNGFNRAHTHRLKAPLRRLLHILPRILLCFGATGALAGADGFDRLAPLTLAVCQAGLSDNPDTLSFSFGSILSVRDRGSIAAGLRRTFTLQGVGDETAIVRVTAVGGAIRTVRGEVHGETRAGKKPLALVDVDGQCAVRLGRIIDYDVSGMAVLLRHFDGNLMPGGPVEALNPPAPEGVDPGGVAVAHIDSGVNYLLPQIAARLARDVDNHQLGRDYWDGDDRPFDMDTGRSPFFPIRHGTSVASVLLREAPNARLIPYRYPRPDMARMKPLVEHASSLGARIVMMPLGSRRAADWRAFVEAATDHDEVLFIVSAGNDGRDIDREPVYPAGFDLDNMIVVTSSDAFGRLAQGSNWGAQAVDVMVPAERIAVVDHRGAAGLGSGSSFAVPRVTALAVRLLGRHPEWSAAQLKAAIRERAGLSFERGPAKLRWGWIANPAEDG